MSPMEKAARTLASLESWESEWESYVGSVRAVLMAVRDGSPEVFAAMDRAQPLWPSSQCDSRKELERSANEPRVRAIIDAILEGE